MENLPSFVVHFQSGSFLLTGPVCGDGLPFGTARDAWGYWRREFAAPGERLRVVGAYQDALYTIYEGPGG